MRMRLDRTSRDDATLFTLGGTSVNPYARFASVPSTGHSAVGALRSQAATSWVRVRFILRRSAILPWISSSLSVARRFTVPQLAPERTRNNSNS